MLTLNIFEINKLCGQKTNVKFFFLFLLEKKINFQKSVVLDLLIIYLEYFETKVKFCRKYFL